MRPTDWLVFVIALALPVGILIAVTGERVTPTAATLIAIMAAMQVIVRVIREQHKQAMARTEERLAKWENVR